MFREGVVVNSGRECLVQGVISSSYNPLVVDGFYFEETQKATLKWSPFRGRTTSGASVTALMSDAINITFMWPANCGEAAAQTTVILRTTAAVMQKRDPDGTSLVSGKLRFTGSNDITISAVGPEEDEFFSPALVEFLADYIRTGSLDCPPDAQGDECERCATRV